MLRILRVQGDSMRPALQADDFVLVATMWRRPQPQRLIVVQHPEYGVIIKRVLSCHADGTCWLSSDNAAGTTTQQLGEIRPEHIIGRVLYCVRQPAPRKTSA